jgi:hypothetical protein
VGSGIIDTRPGYLAELDIEGLEQEQAQERGRGPRAEKQKHATTNIGHGYG